MCTADQIQRYRGKISGPLLDRIDLHVEVARPTRLHYRKRGSRPENSTVVRKRVVAARERALHRAGVPNAQLDNAGVRHYCKTSGKNHKFLEQAAEQMGLSPRGCQRVLKVARTLADLEQQDMMRKRHLAEALAYRGFDRGKNQA